MMSPELYYSLMLITNPQKAIRILTAEDWENWFMDLFDEEYEDLSNGTFLVNQEVYIDRIVDKYLETTGVKITDTDPYSKAVIEKAIKTATQIQETTVKNVLTPVVGKTSDDSEDIKSLIMAGIAFSTTLLANEAFNRWFSKERANLIALNEANWIYNHEEFFEALASKKTKTWHTALDEKVRFSHMEVEGVTIGIDELFDVGGSKMEFPLDSAHGASAEQILNCRCSVEYQ